MNFKPKKGYIYVKFLKNNFELEETDSGILVKGDGKNIAQKVYSAEVMNIGDDIESVDIGDIVYFKNYKPIPVGKGSAVEKNLIITKIGNVLYKRDKTEEDETVNQSF